MAPARNGDLVGLPIFGGQPVILRKILVVVMSAFLLPEQSSSPAPVAEPVDTASLAGLNMKTFTKRPLVHEQSLRYYIASFKEFNANTLDVTVPWNEPGRARKNFKRNEES
jgi:hypothetical protein